MFTNTLTFIEADPPRASWFAYWDNNNPSVSPNTPEVFEESPTISVDLVVPAQRGTKIITVSAKKISLSEILDLLASLSASDTTASRTAQAWSSATRTALTFITEGKVLPWISPHKYDTWRVDPLDIHDLAHVDALATALPATAHATPFQGKKGKIPDPVHTLRTFFDATADCFIRTPAAHKTGTLTLFADQQKTKTPQLRPWVTDLAVAHCASSQLILHVHPPKEKTDDWHLTFHLQSTTDPSLFIDIADFWKTPAEVMEHLGEQVEVVLLAGLRKVTEIVDPLATLLNKNNPTEAWLDDDGLDVLLDNLDELFTLNIDVRWPAELVSPTVERRVVVQDGAPQSSLPSVTGLDALLNVNWEFLLEGVPLTKQELDVLGDAKRAVVQLRGKWVRIDPRLRKRLTERPPELSLIQILAAALTKEIDIPSEETPIPIRSEGTAASLTKKLFNITKTREEPEPPGLQATLRPYQKKGLAWMVDLCELGLGGCLADDMGLGKTIQIISLHAKQAHRRQQKNQPKGKTLVVCPTSLLNNWARETKKFLPNCDVKIYHGTNRHKIDLNETELLLTTYGIVRSDIEKLQEHSWDLLVADEAQHAKNPRSRTAKALRKLQGKNRIALTGTPVENKLSELWSILDWAAPGLLGTLETFTRRIAVPMEKDNDPNASKQLQQLTQPFLLRRKKTDPGIAPELPPKIERNLIVPLAEEQVTLYKAAVDTALAEVKKTEGIKRRGLVLKLLTGLKQITNHPAQYLKQTQPLAGRSGKLQALEEILANTKENNESTLIFTQYVQMGTLLTAHLEKAGHRVEILHGGQTIQARQNLVDAFQNKQLDILVLSVKAGGTGLNLTAATTVVHYDRWWNPAVEDQATDRAYRIGQKQSVTVHKLITQGTVEDRVAELLENKRKLADTAIGNGESWIGELSNDDLHELVKLEVQP